MTNTNLSITQYAQIFNLSPHSIRNKVISGELPAEKHGNRWMIQVNETELPLNQELNQELNPVLIYKLEQQVEDLKEQVEYLKKDIEGRDGQINEFLKQQNQYQQIIMSMNKNQTLLVESKRSWFQKLFGLNSESI